jgi:hypothetical protein
MNLLFSHIDECLDTAYGLLRINPQTEPLKERCYIVIKHEPVIISQHLYRLPP